MIARYEWSAVRLRLAVVLLAAVATALVPGVAFGFVLVATLATVVTVAFPAHVGAVVLVAVELGGWAFAYGTDTSPPVLRTLAFAAVLYLLHASAALVAGVPLEAHVAPGIVTAWAVRCVPGVVAAVVAGTVVGVIGRLDGSVVLDVVGMAAVVAVLAVLVWASRNLDRRESS